MGYARKSLARNNGWKLAILHRENNFWLCGPYGSIKSLDTVWELFKQLGFTVTARGICSPQRIYPDAYKVMQLLDIFINC